ncbi:TetR/AcrR family transcriptional regulator [Amycolatopsis kentuckyensis]|uniref:TetR/AcrR family transcriptional regulator n=1 Tax=Amycolatopsis kentuckyensis TaxID=218823 RepID=UPI003565A8B4
MTDPLPLRERKRRRAQEAIVDAAYALFAERGFADVTVTEIAERAEVGRTTFFRYFGDKREVLFVEEQSLLDALRADATPPAKAPTVREALELGRLAVGAMCAAVTADRERYRLHEKLVAENEELHDRSERKLLNLTETMADRLRGQGMPPAEASLAAHVGLACFRAGRTVAGDDPESLGPAVDAAFEALLRDW